MCVCLAVFATLQEVVTAHCLSGPQAALRLLEDMIIIIVTVFVPTASGRLIMKRPQKGMMTSPWHDGQQI